MKPISDQMKSIMERIKRRRTDLNLSFQQLAELTGMSKSTLQRYETGGIKNIPLDKLEVLANALQTTPEWILGWNTKADKNKPISDIRYAAYEALGDESEEFQQDILDYINYKKSQQKKDE